jgi:hemerythrin-like domain-containing protein
MSFGVFSESVLSLGGGRHHRHAVQAQHSSSLIVNGGDMDEGNKFSPTRRTFLKTGLASGALAFSAGSLLDAAEVKMKHEEEIAPTEDLMREHGVLKRVLLAYREVLRRLDVRQDFPPEALAEAAEIIRGFIEDYHEKLEEDYLFPRFQKANKFVDLVRVLHEQHQAGRRLTDATIHFANLVLTKPAFKKDAEWVQLSDALRQFVRMYDPHEAREDTVLFPAFREIVTPHEFDALGEDFEKREHELFGKEGFQGIVEKVTAIEKRLGIFELSQFTPQ